MQLKLGALRDFETNEVTVQLAQKGQFNHLSSECTKEYLVHVVSFGAITQSNGNLICDCSNHTLYHYDTWEEAQEKYLALADEYNASLKVREWSIQDWLST